MQLIMYVGHEVIPLMMMMMMIISDDDEIDERCASFLLKANFDEVVLTKTKYYVPILVLFYVRIAPLTSDYLKAFDRVRQDMVDKDASIRFGIMEVDNSVRRGMY